MWSSCNKHFFLILLLVTFLTLLVCGTHKTHFELVASRFLIIVISAYTWKLILDFYTWHSNINPENTDFMVHQITGYKGLCYYGGTRKRGNDSTVWGASCVTPDTQLLPTSCFSRKTKVVYFMWNHCIFKYLINFENIAQTKPNPWVGFDAAINPSMV